MADASPTRIGQIAGTGDALALFLKVFSGEVLTAFNRNAMFRDKHTMRTIPSGKSAQFPATGLIGAYTHTPGAEILGQMIKNGEVTINVEGQIIAPAFIANIDEAMSHYDYRSIITTDIGQALSKLFDQDVYHEILNAARLTAPLVNGVYSGDVLDGTLTNASYATDGPTLFNGFMDANVLLDARDVPTEGRNIVVRPVGYALLIKSEKPFDFDLNPGQEGGQGYASGVVRRISGVPIFKSNNATAVDDSANTDQPTRRRVNYSNNVGAMWHKRAAGTVALQDVTIESEYDMRRQGWLTLGKYICGHGTLDPAAAIEIASS